MAIAAQKLRQARREHSAACAAEGCAKRGYGFCRHISLRAKRSVSVDGGLRAFEGSCYSGRQLSGCAPSPIVEKDGARILASHVMVNGDNVDARLAQ